jgi:hypothetical protein
MEMDPELFADMPGTAVSAYRQALTQDQYDELNRFHKLSKLHSELRKLPNETAYSTFTQLDPYVQGKLKETFDIGESPYLEKPANPLVSFLKWYTKDLSSPFKYTMNKLQDYTRTLNTPYRALRAAGADPFSLITAPVNVGGLVAQLPEIGKNLTNKKIWQESWDGSAIFDEKAKAEIDMVYTRGERDLAVGILEGKAPSEIIYERGGIDEDFANAYFTHKNDPEKFATIIEDYKRAQVSPGRDIVRQFGTEFSRPGQSDMDPWFTALSGTIDAAYQVLIDPFTYVSFGTSNLLTKSGRLSEAIGTKGVPGITKYFADPGAKTYWNDFGAKIDEYKTAVEGKDVVKAGVIREEIRTGDFKAYSDDATLDLFMRANIKDADTAERFFLNAEDSRLLINGRVDGITYFRENAPLAGFTSSFGTATRKYVSDFFNGRKTLEQIDATSDDILKEINDIASYGVGNLPSMPVINALNNGSRAFRRKIATTLSNHPSMDVVEVADDFLFKTTRDVKAYARLLVNDPDFASVVTEKFIRSDVGERYNLMKGLYLGLMYKTGLHTTPNGRSLMRQIIDGFSTVNEKTGFKATHVYQESTSVTPLPLKAIADEVYKNTRFKDRPLWKLFNSFTDAPIAHGITDAWVLFTLIPVLGIRSAIDEGFFGSLTTPYSVIKVWASREGSLAEKIAASRSADNRQFGVVKTKILEGLKGLPAQRREAIEKVISPEQSMDEFIKQYRMSGVKNNPATMEFLGELWNGNVNLEAGAYESMIGRINLSDNMDRVVKNPVLTKSEFAKSLEDAKLEKGQTFIDIPIDEFMRNYYESDRALIQLDNMMPRFASMGNVKNIKIDDVQYTIDPAKVFMQRGALRDANQRSLAKLDILRSMGVEYGPNGWFVKNEELLDTFLKPNLQTYALRSQGFSNVDIAGKRVDDMLDDLYFHFHGNTFESGAYNKELYDFISNTAKDKNRSFRQVFKDFNNEPEKYLELLGPDARYGYSADYVGSIRTSVYSPMDNIGTRPEGWYYRFKNWAFGAMDRQVTDLYRSNAVFAWSIKYYNDFQPLKLQYIDQLVNSGLSPKSAESFAARHFSNLASEYAVDRVVKYIDNPNIRSNLAFSLRTVGRFYRATEDFLRRFYRMGKDSTARSIFRVRLLATGLDDVGFVHEDQEGRSYVIIPMDNVMYNVISTTSRMFLNDQEAMKIPQFNEMTLTLSMLNPSMQEDAGLPTLSGPISAISVRAVQRALGLVGGDVGKQFALDFDKMFLGEMAGSNKPWYDLLLPGQAQKFYKQIVPPWWFSESQWESRRDAGTVMAALSYLSANKLIPEQYASGILADGTMSWSSREDFLYQLRRHIHGLNVLKYLMGNVGLNFGMQESLDTPNYMKNIGIATPRQELFDIEAGLSKLPPEQQPSDTFATAVAMFIANNPDRLPYTVSRSETMDVFIPKTKDVQRWVVANEDFLSRFKSDQRGGFKNAAWIFAPHSGEFDLTVYAWMEGQGLIKERDLRDFYLDIQAQKYIQLMYDERNKTKIAIDKTANPSERARLKREQRELEDNIKAAYPRVEELMNFTNPATTKNMLSQLEEIVADPQSPISGSQRKKVSLANTLIRDYVNWIEDNNARGGDVSNVKLGTKERILEELKVLATGDSTMTSALNYVYEPILNFYTRDVTLVSPRGQ